MSEWSVSGKSIESHSCNCIGPQNGQPLCPCQMRGVVERDGHYVKVTDLGPIPNKFDAVQRWRCKCGAEHYSKPKFCSECGAKQ